MSKEWWKSKTKLGSVLVGGSMIVGALGSWMMETMDANAAILQMGTGLGIILAGIGLRNAIDKIQ